MDTLYRSNRPKLWCRVHNVYQFTRNSPIKAINLTEVFWNWEHTSSLIPTTFVHFEAALYCNKKRSFYEKNKKKSPHKMRCISSEQDFFFIIRLYRFTISSLLSIQYLSGWLELSVFGQVKEFSRSSPFLVHLSIASSSKKWEYYFGRISNYR